MVRKYRGELKQLFEKHMELQDEHIQLQIDYVQSLGKKLKKYEGSGKYKETLVTQKETLICTPDVNGKEGGADHGI